MRLLKIKPKDFQKRREQSKTFGDWNKENGSAIIYKSTGKKKKTILDECDDVPRASPRNKKLRINGNEQIGEVIIKIADDLFPVTILLQTIMHSIGYVDGAMLLMKLDSLGIYGEDVRYWYKEAQDDPEQFDQLIDSIMKGDIPFIKK